MKHPDTFTRFRSTCTGWAALTVVLALWAPGSASAQLSAEGYGPLSHEARALFWGSREDAAPEVLDATREDLEGRHYLYSDELNQHLYFPSLEGLGGGLVGVGSDQLYLFAGVMRANLVWLADYDPWIEAEHYAFFAFFAEAETIDAFLALWDHDNEETSAALLRRVYVDHPDRELILEVYDEAARLVHRRLRNLQRRLRELELASFVTDPAQYQFVRDLVASGRMRPMTANLLDEQAYRGIGEVASALGVPLRAIYLSNAESYWDYTANFRANMLALPVDERSLIVRTRATKPQNGDYAYAVQPATLFQSQLQDERVRRLRNVWGGLYIESYEHVPFVVLDESDGR